MTALISLKDIRKTFVNGDVAVEVLRGITLDIQPGEFVAIVGASGSGKSTLMNILGCLDTPTGGQYLLEGEDVSDFNADQLAARRRQMFGFVFQSYNLVPTATAQENVEIPAIYAGMPSRDRRDRAEMLLTSLRLGDRLDHLPNQLSGGQQQRVSIARALMNGGQIILADEPTGALDSQSGKEVMATLRQMNDEGHTVIIITHAPELAESANRIIEISDGLIVADRIPGNVRRIGRTKPVLAAKTRGKAAIVTDVAEAVRMSFRALRANLFRTILTLLGIVIGVSSVVAMLAIGTGAQNSVLDRISSMGSDLLVVRPSMANFRGSAGGTNVTLVPADADAITELANVAFAVPEMTSTVTLRRGNIDYQTTANGTVPQFTEAKSWKIGRGEFINRNDMETYAPVAVLGETVVKTLFPEGSDPIGQYVLVNKIPFQVIGVMSGMGASAGGNDQDDVVLVPLTTGSMRLFGQRNIRTITVKVQDAAAIDLTQERIQALLNERHRKDDTQITNMSSVREAFTETSNTMKFFLGSVAAISLLVGGIGVMNIMLVSVRERTREIGLRKALGATSGAITWQFLVEAITLTVMGGLLGLASGYGMGGIVSLVMSVTLKVSWAPSVPLVWIGVVMLTSVMLGLVFGVYPAYRAGQLDPIVALRYE